MNRELWYSSGLPYQACHVLSHFAIRIALKLQTIQTLIKLCHFHGIDYYKCRKIKFYNQESLLKMFLKNSFAEV